MIEEGDNDFVLNDSIGKIYETAQKDPNPAWKKKLMIGSAIGVFIILVLIIILIVVKATSNQDNEKVIIGQIDLTYKIDDISKKTLILSPDFHKGKNDFDIYIGKEKIVYTLEYPFKERKTYNLYIKFYSDLNLNYMFKDVTALTSAVFFFK